MSRVNRKAFTLVELLVVMAIIGILMSLLLPAVQYARESARRINCVSNLHNLAIAAQQYEGSNRIYPMNWGAMDTAHTNPDKALGTSWITGLLPNLDQMPLYQIIRMGQPLDYYVAPSGGSGGNVASSSKSSTPNKTASQMPIRLLLCPSDLFDAGNGLSNVQSFLSMSSAPDSQALAVTCYKGCLGMNTGEALDVGGKELLIGFKGRNAGKGTGAMPTTGPDHSNGVFCRNGSATPNNLRLMISNSGGGGSGISVVTYGPRYPLTTAAANISDGQSNTIMFGESVSAWSPYSVWFSWDGALCWAAYPINYDFGQPRTEIQRRRNATEAKSKTRDIAGRLIASRHPGGANVAMADGSVRWLPEGTDYHILWAMSTIDGGEIVDMPE